MSNKEIDIHMSENLDEETKSILAKVEADVASSSDDSKNIKKDKKEYKNDDFNNYDISDNPDADDSDW